MFKVILILLSVFFIGFFYSIYISKFTRLKIILLLPSIFCISWAIYSIFFYKPDIYLDLDAITVVILDYLMTSILLGNLIGFLFRKRAPGH